VSERIVIVDDSKASRDLFATLLSKTFDQAEIAVFGNGPAALAAVRESKTDFVLLDARMPGMNGFEVCRRLKGDPETCSRWGRPWRTHLNARSKAGQWASCGRDR
jgi:CheY-like chemotaxis protein